MPVEIFFCYAREDEALRQGLEKQLRALKRQRIIDIWHDREISAGTDWAKQIDKHLETAEIILLLVSPDFMDSDYCYGIEMQRAMQRHNHGEARVIPIILRPVYWKNAPFGKLQALPMDGKPVTSAYWRNNDDAFFDAAEGIRKVAMELMTEMSRPVPTDNYHTVDEQVSLWLEATASKSARTKATYQEEIAKYRAVLHENGLDLDSEDEITVASLVQQWAASSRIAGKEVTPSTFNLHVSIASSFYRFAYKHRWIRHNPIEWVERREEHRNNAAIPLEPEQVKQGLKSIDRSHLRGKRDYAILQILLRTGRTVSEVAGMRCGDIVIGEKIVTITFPKCRGSKVMVYDLPKTSATAQSLINYLVAVYADVRVPEAPVWVSFSPVVKNKGNMPVGIHGISGVCQMYLGTTKVQTTRQIWLKLQEGVGTKELENMLNID